MLSNFRVFRKGADACRLHESFILLHVPKESKRSLRDFLKSPKTEQLSLGAQLQQCCHMGACAWLVVVATATVAALFCCILSPDSCKL